MNKFQILVLVLILSVSCKQDQPKPVVKKKVTPPIEVKKDILNDSISGYINPNLGLFSFIFTATIASNSRRYPLLKDIRIKCNNIFVQDIKIKEYVDWTSGKSVKKFELKDWNFDGYKDITIRSDISAKGNASYLIWIYSPKYKKYIFNDQLSELCDLTLDSVTKTIKSHFRAGQDESWETLKYKQQKFITIETLMIEKYPADGRGCVKTTRTKRINNKMKLTVDSVFVTK